MRTPSRAPRASTPTSGHAMNTTEHGMQAFHASASNVRTRHPWAHAAYARVATSSAMRPARTSAATGSAVVPPAMTVQNPAPPMSTTTGSWTYRTYLRSSVTGAPAPKQSSTYAARTYLRTTSASRRLAGELKEMTLNPAMKRGSMFSRNGASIAAREYSGRSCSRRLCHWPWQRRHALVCGASQGLGQVCAQPLAESNAAATMLSHASSMMLATAATPSAASPTKTLSSKIGGMMNMVAKANMPCQIRIAITTNGSCSRQPRMILSSSIVAPFYNRAC